MISNFKTKNMKKVLLSVIAMVAFTISVSAQTTFGVKAGVNLATLGGDVEDADGITSFHIGGVAEIGISEKFSFQPELLFSAQGASFEDSGEDYAYEENLKLNYINIPLMAKLYLTEGFSVEAGPQIGLLLSANVEGEDTFMDETESFDEDVKDSFKGIDFGFNLGLGYKLEGGLNFGARYNLGLSDINSEDDDDYKITNGVFQISVGYFF